MKESFYVAADIGATRIKMAAAVYKKGRLHVRETYSQDNPPVRKQGHEFADISRMMEALRQGLEKFSAKGTCISFGIDTYGNGYGLLDKAGNLIQEPHHYRDRRIDSVMENVRRHYADRQLYEETGNIPVKTRGLFHLYQDVLEMSPNIRFGDHFLPLSNLLEYLMTGEKGTERTIASVLYLLDRMGEQWNYPVFHELGIPAGIFGPISEPGKKTGEISGGFGRESGLTGIPVITVAGHDTESALLAAPGLDGSSAFVSLGTSFIFGARVEAPVVNDQSFENHFKNIRGAFGSYSLCKDFPGFWILERMMEHWRKEQPDLSYETICRAVQSCGKNTSFIHVSDDRFRVTEADLPSLIREYLRQTGQKPVEGLGETARCLFESYALQLRWCLDKLSGITGVEYRKLVAVNGGVKNRLLLQMFADATGLPVIAGSPLASACGNLLMQISAAGEAGTPEEMNQVAARSWAPETYESRSSSYWVERYQIIKQKGLFRETLSWTTELKQN
ncbi:FGGY-family carbohydrate kinase [Lachnospiraceae bacterium 54-53]